MLPLTGADAFTDRCAIGRCGPRLCGPTDGAEAEVVEPSREHPPQDAVAGRPGVVRIDDGQPVPRSPLQVKVIIVGVHRAAPCDLQGGVGHPPEQDGGRWSGS